LKFSIIADNYRFRLVALQLDALSRLRSESKIRSAMIELPVTLDTFYDRILFDIQDEDDQEIAVRALRWLGGAARPISLEELAEAVIIRPDAVPYVCDEDRFLDYKELLEILPSGLVAAIPAPPVPSVPIGLTSEDEETSTRMLVQFAHFSVKE